MLTPLEYQIARLTLKQRGQMEYEFRSMCHRGILLPQNDPNAYLIYESKKMVLTNIDIEYAMASERAHTEFFSATDNDSNYFKDEHDFRLAWHNYNYLGDRAYSFLISGVRAAYIAVHELEPREFELLTRPFYKVIAVPDMALI